jgi:fucose 4-O-acetylase-like acetyltransferase
MAGKNRLYEMDYIRIYLIFALIICHAFAPFNTWPSVCGFDIEIYKYIAKFAYSAMLETFVFVSGYLFYRKLNDGVNFWQLVKNKFVRLLAPCYLFGLLYVALCDEMSYGALHKIFNGYGHLWFLPMLFWVFVIYWCLFSYVKRNMVMSSIVLFILAILPYPSMPMHINNAMYYLLFFHLGVIINSSESFKLGITSLKKLPFIAIAYIVLFIIGMYVMDRYLLTNIDMPILKKAVVLCVNNICRFAYSVVGVVLFYSIAYNIAKVRRINISSFAELCFGVYLFQEIILRILYYKFNIGIYIGPYLTPWVAYVVTMLVSILIVYIIRQSKIIKNII